MPWPAVQHLSFPVRDVRRSAAFYRDLLGFRELHASDAIAELLMGETKLVLLRASGAVTPPHGLHFGFHEDEPAGVDDWARKAKEAGAAVESGPARADWGGYVLYVRDPDGYLIEIWADH